MLGRIGNNMHRSFIASIELRIQWSWNDQY